MSPTPCTHADAEEANKRFRRDAEEAWNRYLDANDGHGWRRDPRKVVAELKAKREEPKP